MPKVVAFGGDALCASLQSLLKDKIAPAWEETDNANKMILIDRIFTQMALFGPKKYMDDEIEALACMSLEGDDEKQNPLASLDPRKHEMNHKRVSERVALGYAANAIKKCCKVIDNHNKYYRDVVDRLATLLLTELAGKNADRDKFQ